MCLECLNLASKILARDDSETLRDDWCKLIKAHLSVRPSLRRVIIWNRIIEKARKLAEEMRDNGVFDGVSFESNTCLTEAGRGAFGFCWVIQALYEGVRRRGKVLPC
jgi:hypothetical protein